MIAFGPTVIPDCPNTVIIYGAAPIFSLVFSIILMIIGFIIPCVTNRKVIMQCFCNNPIDNQ